RCALGAKAWAALMYDPYDDRWHNVMMDGNDVGAWIGANPLVVCDVSDHAFGTDYRGRDQYVEKFIEHVDWNEVARRYKAVDRMWPTDDGPPWRNTFRRIGVTPAVALVVRGWVFVLAVSLATAPAGCRRFEPIPLSSEDTAVALENRSLADPELRA